jgi:DNA-binding transcriptional regulator YiaG
MTDHLTCQMAAGERNSCHNKSIAATREKIGLSQSRFTRLLGISVRTLHH